jgi:hypothetical protein
MNIRPIDMQVLIPRAIDVSKVQQLANEQVTVNQQLLGEQLKKMANHQQHQVKQLLQSEGGKVTSNKEKTAQQQQQQQQNATKQDLDSNSSEEEVIFNRPSQSDPVRGHSIDIIT